jgi:hypothetical protein
MEEITVLDVMPDETARADICCDISHHFLFV